MAKEGTPRNQEFGRNDPELAIISMANMFFGKVFPNNRAGFAEAIQGLREQQQRIKNPMPRNKILQMVANNDPQIFHTEHMVARALEANDVEAALLLLNHLFEYGEIAHQDFAQSQPFELSLNMHRKLAARLRTEYAKVDPYLREHGEAMFTEIEQLREEGNFHRELQLLQGIIHAVVVNGTLGEEAKKHFDPFAIISEVR